MEATLRAENFRMDLLDLLGQPEGKTLEFKRDLSSLQPVLKTLVAFANTAGGTLIVGRANDGVLHGLSGVGEAEERLANAVADGIAPGLLPDIEAFQINGADLLAVRVARWPGPFHLRAEGPVNGVYVRLGSTNRRAGPEILSDLGRAASHLVFDQAPCLGAEVEDLDLEFIRKTFAAVDREIDNPRLESLGVLVRHGRHLLPSHGGMILFGKPSARQRFFPDAQVRCARFVGPDKVEFLDRLDIEGSVLDALEEIPRFIRRNTRLAARIEGMLREDIPEYPRIALREALVNAVAHTDYTLRGMQILIAIYSDRLEIQNPGMLAFGMTLEDLRAGVSRIRNPVIARVFRELNLMEKWGSGYRRIGEDCDTGGYPLPEWLELGSVIRVVFRPHPEVTPAGTKSGPSRDQVGTKSGPSRDQVSLLHFARQERSIGDLMTVLAWSNRSKFRSRFIVPLLKAGWLAMTLPDRPTSSNQRYFTTEEGLRMLPAVSPGSAKPVARGRTARPKAR